MSFQMGKLRHRGAAAGTKTREMAEDVQLCGVRDMGA